MANRIFLIENRSYRDLTPSRQDQLEGSCSRVPGARMQREQDVRMLLQSQHFSDGVLVVPVGIPEFQDDISTILKLVERTRPHTHIFGLCFALMAARKSFDVDSLGEPYWIEMLDRFYDQAVPTGFVTFYKEAAQVQQFQLCASISGLFREIDSISELRRIGATVQELEVRLSEFEAFQTGLPGGRAGP
jgi:hypothetical protein